MQRFWGSPTAAYRADMRGRNVPFSPHDNAWLVIANTVHGATTTPGGGRAGKEQLFDALGQAIDLLGDERIDAWVKREWNGDRSYVEAIVVLADLIARTGALHLAAIFLDDVLIAAKDLSVLERGRILAHRARLERQLGNMDDAVERYQYVASLETEAHTGELEARAEIGLSAIAQLRGNLPALRLHSRRAAELADRLGFPALARLAYQGVAVAAVRDGDYDEAIVAGWNFVQLSRGEPVGESEALQHLGQVLLEAGHTAVARACFAAVMTRPAPPRVLLPALGGLARASGQLGNEVTVEWSMREVWMAQQSPVPRYELADALLECAIALAALGRDDDADRYREAGHAIASAEGFHELVFRAADLDRVRSERVASPRSLRPTAAAVAREVSALEPEQLPAHVSFDAAPV